MPDDPTPPPEHDAVLAAILRRLLAQPEAKATLHDPTGSLTLSLTGARLALRPEEYEALAVHRTAVQHGTYRAEPTSAPLIDLAATAMCVEALGHYTDHPTGDTAATRDLARELSSGRRAVTTLADYPHVAATPGNSTPPLIAMEATVVVADVLRAYSEEGGRPGHGVEAERVLLTGLADDLDQGRRAVTQPAIPGPIPDEPGMFGLGVHDDDGRSVWPDDEPRPNATGGGSAMGVSFTGAQRERLMELMEQGSPGAIYEAQRIILGELTAQVGTPDPAARGHYAPTLDEVVALGEYAAAVQDEQAPGLAAAVALLVDVLGKHDVDQPVDEWDDHDLDELHTAADAVAFVFHRMPVEGWRWVAPGYGLALVPEAVAHLASALARVLAEGGTDAYLVDSVPMRLVIDPGLTVAVSAEEAEAIRTAGARVIPGAATPPAAPRVPPPDVPGAGNVATPDPA